MTANQNLTAVTDETGNEIAGYTYDTDGNLAERNRDRERHDNHLCLRLPEPSDSNEEPDRQCRNIRVQLRISRQRKKARETATVIDKKGKKTAKTAAYAYDLLGRITKETQTAGKIFLTPTTTIIIKSK